MVTLTFTPVALGKVGTPHARPSAGPAHGGAPKMYVALSHNSRNSDPTPGAGGLANGRNAAADVLAYGRGYTTTHGSQAVRALQRRLAGLGYQPGPVDGRYGPLTEAAVRRFQATHSLTADGIAGVRTMAALAAAQPVLYPGQGYGQAASPAVRSLQRHLAAAGFSPGPIDGRYGPLTERAVARFQTARHLQADGIAGPQTINHLRSVPNHHQQQHQTQPRQSTGRRQTRPAPALGAAPRHGNPAPQPTRQPSHHSAGFPLVWVIVLAGLLLAVLATLLWHRRRGAEAESDARPSDTGSPDRGPTAATTNGARAAVPESTRAPESTSVPESTQVPESTPVPERTPVPESTPGTVAAGDPARGLSAPETESRRAAAQPDGAAAFRLGLLLAQDGDRVGAEDAFRRADERGHTEAAYELGHLLMQEGNVAGAREAFGRADRAGHAGAAFDLGMLLLQQGDPARAQQAFRRADSRGHPDAAFELAALLLQDGDDAGAEDAFRRGDEFGDGGAASNLGVLLEQRGDLVEAKKAYERADQRGHAVGAFNLGALLEEQGDVAAAKEAYGRADERGDADGAYRLGRLLESEGDRAAAKEAYRRADERGHPEGACNLGLLLKDEGDHAGAVGALQRVGERGSPDAVKVAQAALLELDPREENGR